MFARTDQTKLSMFVFYVYACGSVVHSQIPIYQYYQNIMPAFVHVDVVHMKE